LALLSRSAAELPTAFCKFKRYEATSVTADFSPVDVAQVSPEQVREIATAAEK